MKITVDNYKEAEARIDWQTASAALNTGKAFTQKGIGSYHKAPTVKTAIDKYFLLLEKTLSETPVPAKSKNSPVPKQPPKASVTNKQAPKKTKQDAAETTAALVEHIPTDIALIRRFTNLHGKVKNYDQILSIWRAFEKAIVERKVTKGSPFQAEIKYMKDSLTNALRAAKESGTIELAIPAPKYKNFKVIADSVARSVGVSILLEFINISGRPRMQERAKKLQTRIKKALADGKLKGDRYIDEVKSALKDLNGYVGSKMTKIEMNDYYLSGVGEIAVHGCKCGGSLQGFNRGQNAVILKLIQEKAKNFTAPELKKVFTDTVAPEICKLIVRRLVDTGQLTMSMIRNPAKPKTSIALNGVKNEQQPGHTYDFDVEVMDMRLRNAERQLPVSVDHTISGLSGISEVTHSGTSVAARNVPITNSMTLANIKFSTIGFTGKWLNLIGDPSKGFSAMVFGKPKMGKSYMCMEFAGYLAAHFGKTLYIAKEERVDKTLQDKMFEKKANHPNLDFAPAIPIDKLASYKFIFFDSVNSLGLTPDYLRQLKAQYPGVSFIYIFQTTKDGKFRGANEFQHDVDVVIEVYELGKAVQFGRFNQGGKMNIF